MDAWLSSCLEAVRAHLTPQDEGSLWVLLFDEDRGEPVLAVALDGRPTALAEEDLRNLVVVIDAAGADAVLLVVPRRSGIPRAVDRQLWSRVKLATTTLLDVIVLGPAAYWSAAAEGADAPRRHRAVSPTK